MRSLSLSLIHTCVWVYIYLDRVTVLHLAVLAAWPGICSFSVLLPSRAYLNGAQAVASTLCPQWPMFRPEEKILGMPLRLLSITLCRNSVLVRMMWLSKVARLVGEQRGRISAGMLSPE